MPHLSDKEFDKAVDALTAWEIAVNRGLSRKAPPLDPEGIVSAHAIIVELKKRLLVIRDAVSRTLSKINVDGAEHLPSHSLTVILSSASRVDGLDHLQRKDENGNNVTVRAVRVRHGEKMLDANPYSRLFAPFVECTSFVPLDVFSMPIKSINRAVRDEVRAARDVVAPLLIEQGVVREEMRILEARENELRDRMHEELRSLRVSL